MPWKQARHTGWQTADVEEKASMALALAPVFNAAHYRFLEFVGSFASKRRQALIRRLTRRADERRDSRLYADAAKIYRAVLALARQRIDIRVQYGNMLKDSGQLVEAETAYRSALAERPDDADIHLQLGHCLKWQGRRQAALEAYQRAAGLAPFSIEPQRELFLMGQRQTQESLFEVQLRHGGVEALMEVARQVVELRSTLSRMVEGLPDIEAQMAFPIGSYDRFR